MKILLLHAFFSEIPSIRIFTFFFFLHALEEECLNTRKKNVREHCVCLSIGHKTTEKKG